MIQALNSVNTASNCCGGKRKQSFGDCQQEPTEQIIVRTFERPAKKTSPSKRLGVYAATHFAAGALVSSLMDGGVNAWRAVFKNKPLISGKQVVANAGSLGVWFALVGVVFTAISAAMARNNK